MPTVRFWAGARALAGTADHDVAAGTLSTVLEALRADFGSQLGELVDRSVLLLDGLAIDRRTDPIVGPTSCLEILPPYAGG